MGDKARKFANTVYGKMDSSGGRKGWQDRVKNDSLNEFLRLILDDSGVRESIKNEVPELWEELRQDYPTLMDRLERRDEIVRSGGADIRLGEPGIEDSGRGFRKEDGYWTDSEMRGYVGTGERERVLNAGPGNDMTVETGMDPNNWANTGVPATETRLRDVKGLDQIIANFIKSQGGR